MTFGNCRCELRGCGLRTSQPLSREQTPAHFMVRLNGRAIRPNIDPRELKLEDAWIAPPVQKKILTRHVTRLDAAQEGTGGAEFLNFPEPATGDAL
jgi:hypothetical protein